INLAAFGIQALGTRWMIQRLGASWSASVLPAGLGLTTLATLVFPGFVTVAAGRLWDQITRLSVNQPVGELFYFPLDPALRRRALQVARLRHLVQFAARVDEMIHDDDPEVQVQALSAHCAFSDTDLFEPLLQYLQSPNPRVRVAAIVCLIEQAPTKDEDRLRV